MKFQTATSTDVLLLAEMNLSLIRDEKHRNSMGLPELEQRMRRWLDTGKYSAIIFYTESVLVGYALYRQTVNDIYLRQFYIRDSHRRKGYGRNAVQVLRERVWPSSARITLEVLKDNTRAYSFWKSVGFEDYAVTMELPRD